MVLLRRLPGLALHGRRLEAADGAHRAGARRATSASTGSTSSTPTGRPGGPRAVPWQRDPWRPPLAPGPRGSCSLLPLPNNRRRHHQRQLTSPRAPRRSTATPSTRAWTGASASIEHVRPLQPAPGSPRPARSAFGAGGGPGVVDLGGNTKVKNQSLALGVDYTLSTHVDPRRPLRLVPATRSTCFPTTSGSNPALDAGIPGMNMPRRSVHVGPARRFINNVGNGDTGQHELRHRARRPHRPLQLPARRRTRRSTSSSPTSPRAWAPTPRSSASTSGGPTTCACRATTTAPARSTSTRSARRDRRAAAWASRPSCWATSRLSPLRQHRSTDARERQWRWFLLRAGHLARRPRSWTVELRPARSRTSCPQTVNEAGNAGLLRPRDRRDEGRGRRRRRPRRRHQEQDQLGAAPGHHLPVQREDRDAPGLRAQLRHRRVRLDLRPQRDPEPARAGPADPERARRTSSASSHLAQGPAAADASPQVGSQRPLRGSGRREPLDPARPAAAAVTWTPGT